MHDLVVIYLSGMTGIWKAIPIGIVLKTPPLSIYLMTVLGASTAVVLIYLFDGWVRQFVQRKMKRDKLMRKKIKMDKLVSKFGVIGIGLLGTLSMGPNITILMGLMVVNEKIKLLVWIIIGILLWSTILTSAAARSSELFEQIAFFR
jgi:membrane protein YqaA with SNARE-associated domain